MEYICTLHGMGTETERTHANPQFHFFKTNLASCPSIGLNMFTQRNQGKRRDHEQTWAVCTPPKAVPGESLVRASPRALLSESRFWPKCLTSIPKTEYLKTENAYNLQAALTWWSKTQKRTPTDGQRTATSWLKIRGARSSGHLPPPRPPAAGSSRIPENQRGLIRPRWVCLFSMVPFLGVI